MIADQAQADRTIGAPERYPYPWQRRLWGPRWDQIRSLVRPRSLGTAGAFAVADVHYAGLRTPEHTHDWDSLHLVLHGDVTEFYDGARRRARAGSLLVYRAGVPHRTAVSPGARIVHMPLSDTEIPGDRRLTSQTMRIGSVVLTSALRVFATLFANRSEDDHHERGEQILDSFERLKDGSITDRRAHATARMLQTAEHQLSLQKIADEVGMSRGQLARVFRQTHGCSIGEMTHRVRVTQALLRLLRGGDSLVMIATQTGYADQSHMGRDFKRILGVTPGRLLAACDSK